MKNLISNVVDGEATMGWAGVSYPHAAPLPKLCTICTENFFTLII